MKYLEESVRVAVEELAASAPYSHDLATVARSRGRRIRRRQQMAVGLAAVLLVGAVVTPYAILDGRQAAPVPIAPSPSPTELAPAPVISEQWWKEPVRLPGGFVITALSQPGKRLGQGKSGGSTPQTGNVVLDRSTGRYRVLDGEFSTVIGAPAGKYAIVYRGQDLGIADSTTGQVRQFDFGPATSFGAQWSPDGTRLLLTRENGFRILDPATGEHQDRDTPGGLSNCADQCFFAWLSPTEVSLPQRQASSQAVAAMHVFSTGNGALLRTVPLVRTPVSGQNAVSPDGRHMLIDPDRNDMYAREFIDVRSGRTVGTFRGIGPAHFVADDQILVVGSKAAVLYDLAGNELQSTSMPPEFSGRRISVGRL
ncbi:hypothetical protein OHA21_39400 [Actinoplanes sp. NBC_00393]|uniref:hypothetical protein n=1 Tax=Actinoplanes sp. NBC_00393 TaxID=2975953 RepID=UPI002E1B4DE5